MHHTTLSSFTPALRTVITHVDHSEGIVEIIINLDASLQTRAAIKRTDLSAQEWDWLIKAPRLSTLRKVWIQAVQLDPLSERPLENESGAELVMTVIEIDGLQLPLSDAE